LSLESVDNIERGHRLALGMLCVCDGIADDTLEEGLQDTASLFVDHWRRLAEARLESNDGNILAEIRLTPPRRARRRIAGFVIPWMLSRKIFR
jgi:hypothetical protein